MSDRWDGKCYEERSKPQKQFVFNVLQDISFKGHETILDIGCRDGKVVATIV